MTECFRCGILLLEDDRYLCDSCRNSEMDAMMARQPKRFQGLAEKELKRNARSMVK